MFVRQSFSPSGARTLAALIVLGLFSGSARAAEDEAEWTFRAPITNVLAVSIAYQFPLDLEKKNGFGSGIVYTRDYFVSRRTALGIVGGARMFPASPWHFALGYGLSIKHYVGPIEVRPTTTGLYFLYGLQAQMNVLEGRSGAATDHDTRLAIGYDFRTGAVTPVFEAGYHITQLRHFDADTLWWPYTELIFGLRWE